VVTAVLFVLLLAGATLAATATSVVGRRPATLRDHARRGLAAAMVVAGLAHLLSPEPFVQHVPGWVPGREPLVLLTGLIEIGLGCALAGSPARRVATGRVLALYLVAVWPANVYVAVAGVDVEGQPGGRSPWIRLPFQALFIAWALWSTGAGATVSEGSAPSTRPGAATTDDTRGRSEP
jgi:uncharacterized membrane protein